MEKRIAICITWLFHPLFIPTYGIFLLCRIYSSAFFIQDSRLELLMLAITLVSTCFLPGLSVLILVKTGYIRDLQLTARKERSVPYLITAAFYLLAYHILKDTPVPSSMLSAIRLSTLGGMTAVLITAMINLKWKISAHTVALGGLSGTLFSLSLILPDPPLNAFCLTLFVAGLTGAARLKMHAHTSMQIYAGFLLGFTCTFLLMFHF